LLSLLDKQDTDLYYKKILVALEEYFISLSGIEKESIEKIGNELNNILLNILQSKFAREYIALIDKYKNL